MKLICISLALFCLFPLNLYAKKLIRAEMGYRKERVKTELGKAAHANFSIEKLVRHNLMSEIVLRDSRISESQLTSFLKETSKDDKNIQGFYNFLLKSQNKVAYKEVSSLFVDWLVLNHQRLDPFNLISVKQLSVLIQNLTKKEMTELSSALKLAKEMMKEDVSLSADFAFQKAMEEKGINSEYLRKCKR